MSSSQAAASLAFCSVIMRCTAASIFAASRSKSVRVPLFALDALDGSFTPSMAKSSRPISPWRSHTSSTWQKRAWASSPRLQMKCATEVKCGALSPETAMNSTLVRQALAMERELISPREYPSSTILSSTAGSKAGAPPASLA